MHGTFITREDCLSPLDLTQSEILVWKVSLDQPDERIDKFWNYLQNDERARADQYKAELHRSRYIVGRGVLRELLGGYLNFHPELIAFLYGAFGKPSIDPDQNPNDIRFNLAHSNNLALYAFSIEREIGIDLEWIHPIPEIDGVAAKSFSPNEYRSWADLPETEKETAFYRCWTRKEAFIKAIGNGFSFPLDQFEVAFQPGKMPKLLQVETIPSAAQHWLFRELPHISGYAAAIISEKDDWSLVCYEYQ